jgi:hypothetical protein
MRHGRNAFAGKTALNFPVIGGKKSGLRLNICLRCCVSFCDGTSSQSVLSNALHVKLTENLYCASITVETVDGGKDK